MKLFNKLALKNTYILLFCLILLNITLFSYTEQVSPLFAQSLEKSKQSLDGKEVDLYANRTTISGKEEPGDVKVTIQFCATMDGGPSCYTSANLCYGYIYIDPTSYDFSYIAIPDSKEMVFTLEADGTESTNINDISITGDTAFEIIQAPTFPITMNDGDLEEIIVRFTPTQVGEVSATLIVESNQNDISVPLAGIGGYSTNSPDKPVCLSPANGAIAVLLTPTLTATEFSDLDEGDFHLSSQWKVDDNSDFSSPEFDSDIDIDNLTSCPLPIDILSAGTQYYWRVRYMDNCFYYSDWSDPRTFTTRDKVKVTVPTDYLTIQEAIDNVGMGDEIIVEEGVYGNIDFNGRDIFLHSVNPIDKNVVNNTIIEDTKNESCVVFKGTESSDCIISGFTIRGGGSDNDPDYYGGGGIEGNGTLVTIKNNIITDNYAHRGAGIAECDGLIKNNIIKNNVGGGLYECGGTITNNIIWKNSAYDGAGLGYCHGTISNNVIVNNTNNGGYLHYEITACEGINYNNIIWGDCIDTVSTVPELALSSCPSHSCLQEWGGLGTGNISDDPMFVDPENGDFHLQEGSPCIDTGNPAIIHNDGNIPPGMGTERNDMGAYGGPDNIGWVVDFDRIASNSFANDSEGWATGGAAGYFSMPYFWAGNGVLMIYSADHNTYGYWEQPHDAIPYVADSIYKATFRVRGTVDQIESPTLRCRINTESATVIGLIVIESFLGGEESPGLEYKDYVLYLDPMDQSGYQDNELSDDIFAAVEMVNMWADNNATSGFYIESINIDRIDKALIPEAQTVKIYDTSNDFLSWEFGGVEPLFTIPIGERTVDSLTLTANNNNTNTYGFWDLSRTCNEIDIEPNKLYKVKFTVSSPTAQEFTPMLRLRINTESNKMAYVHTIYSNLDGTNSPSSSGTEYETYFYPPQSDVGQAEEINGLILGFDLANIPIAIPDDPNGMLKLDKVEVQTIDMELMP